MLVSFLHKSRALVRAFSKFLVLLLLRNGYFTGEIFSLSQKAVVYSSYEGLWKSFYSVSGPVTPLSFSLALFWFGIAIPTQFILE